MKITMEWLQKQGACTAGKKWFARQFESNAITVLEALIADNKSEWANWLIARLLKRKQQLKYAVFAAELVLLIWEAKYPDDNRPALAIAATKACIIKDSKKNREAAADAAYAADIAACAVDATIYAIIYAANAAAADAAYAANNAAYAAADDADATLQKIIRYGIKLLKEEVV